MQPATKTEYIFLKEKKIELYFYQHIHNKNIKHKHSKTNTKIKKRKHNKMEKLKTFITIDNAIRLIALRTLSEVYK